MASTMALRRAGTASNLLTKLLNPIRPSTASLAPSCNRLYNTNAQIRDYEPDDREIDIDSRRASDRPISRGGFAPSFFSDMFDPFSPTRSLSQVLNMMDQFMDRGIGGGSTRRAWDVKEDEKGLYLRMDMPGVGKEDVKVGVEQSTLTIRAQGEIEEGEDEQDTNRRRYSSRIEIPANLYKLDQIKAEMKNGVLKVFVPRVKEEEMKDVFQVKVE